MSVADRKTEYVLTFSSKDQPGLVAKVTGLLFENHANILSSQQYNDLESQQFFMRVSFVNLNGQSSFDQLKSEFSKLSETLRLDYALAELNRRKKVLMMVSKFDHCLGDLLYRMRIGEMPMDVVGIVSNHPKSALNLTTFGDIPYYHLPISKETKFEQENKIKTIIEQTGAELIVLARYMQILSDDFSTYLAGRCVNIHHSFLPGFKGARPYHQAYKRGVKIIGATAHFVTSELDEGPIIYQDTEQISHADTPSDLIRIGRNIEQRVLSRAVMSLLQDRVLINGDKTVVFD